MTSAADGRVADLVARARAGEPRAVARLISLVEDGAPALRPIIAALAPSVGHARVIGLTGSPGVGKSTLVGALTGLLRRRGERVAVLAVDPSSPFSGGAVLGDRIRMQEHALDPGVYIRSMATRGQLGGLSAAVPLALRILDGAGIDTVLLETVGIGQSEVEVARVADAVVVLAAPGLGDGVQAAKAGVLEIGDVYVVNKADRDGAQAVVRDLRTMLALGERDPGAWSPRILTTVAVRGEGIADLLGALDAFRAHALASGELAARRLDRARREVEGIALGILRARWSPTPDTPLGDLAVQVRDGLLDPYAAADAVLSRAGDVL